MKKLIISVLIILFGITLEAQYLPQVSHFMYDHLRTNPGSTGSTDMVQLGLIYRDQYTALEGNPNTTNIYGEAPFNLGNTKHGVGLNIYLDAAGLQSDITPSLNYAYRFAVGNGTLGVGIQAGIIDGTLDYANLRYPDTDNVTDGPGDADMAFTMGAGIFYRTEEIYFGASVLNINEPEIVTQNNNNEFNYNLNRQYYVTAGYNMQLSNPAWELMPAVLLNSVGSVTYLDVNLTCVYNKKIWGGVSYRTGAAVVGMVGFELFEGFKAGFAYDAATTALINTSSSYEFFINYSFKIGVEKAPQKYKSIRFL